MNKAELLLLIGQIGDTKVTLTKIEQMYTAYQPNFTNTETRDIRDAVMLAEILVNSYTCIETILFRITRIFENHLDAQQWHKELLRKMLVDVPHIRKAVLSRETYTLLDELRRFRHFKRYYYDFDYDWPRLEYLKSVYDRLMPLIRKDLDNYIVFLSAYADDSEP